MKVADIRKLSTSELATQSTKLRENCRVKAPFEYG